MFLWIALGSAAAGVVRAEATPSSASDPTELEFETDALSTLNDLQLTAPQIAALKVMSADTAGKPHTDAAQFTPRVRGDAGQALEPPCWAATPTREVLRRLDVQAAALYGDILLKYPRQDSNL